MLTAIPLDEMAETLRALAGPNAGNAARHFGKRSFDSDDVAAAVYWSNIAQMLDCAAGAAAAPSDAVDEPPVPRRMKIRSEATAFDDVRFEDVEADLLVREAAREMPAERKDVAADEARESPKPMPLHSPQPGRAEDGARDGALSLPLAA